MEGQGTRSRLAPYRHPNVRYRGAFLGRRDLARIRRIIAKNPDLGRTALSREVCRSFGWRRANGELSERSCRALLSRLNERKLIILPPSTAKVRRKRSICPKGDGHGGDPPPWPTTAKASFLPTGRSSLEVRPILPGERNVWHLYVRRFHYLGDTPLIGESLAYAAFREGQVVALLGWGSAALSVRARDEFIGWNERTRLERLQFVVNNLRFLILPWGRRPNLASQVLAANLRRLSADWEARYGHPVYLAETFVDSSRFRGTCYRASNWIELGESSGWSKQGFKYVFHGRPKIVFVHSLHRRARELLKGEKAQEDAMSTAVIDVRALPMDGKGGLIEVLRKLPDPRERRGCRHPFFSIVAMSVCAVLSGARGFEAIAEWATGLTKKRLRRLGCRRPKPPDESTFRRVLQRADTEAIDKTVCEWITHQVSLRGKALAVDGKIVRGSGDGKKKPTNLLSAMVHGNGVVVSQYAVSSKTNEIPCVEPLLKDLDIKGTVVTLDALHTQKKTAKHIVKKKKADYVLVAKDNQPTLREDIETLGLSSFPPSVHPK